MATKLPAIVKDILVLVAVFGVILGGLYLFTGVWPPAVIVESGSMMHKDGEVKVLGTAFGRLGTIDPGDMVLVKRIDDPTEVTTLAQGGRDRYGAPGDVVVYYRDGLRERHLPGGGSIKMTPIIHRAIAWVELSTAENGAREYLIQWNAERPCPNTSALPENGMCRFGSEGITVPEYGLFSYKPEKSGLVTKGDNPYTNARADQSSGLSTIVQEEWIEGKARGEIPWLGLIKLAIGDRPNERSPPPAWMRIGNAYAPKDLWIMLGVSLVLLVGVPVGYDAWKAYDDRRRPKQPAVAPPATDAPSAPDAASAPGDPPPPRI